MNDAEPDTTRPAAPEIIVVMGVSGSGKTTLAAALAAESNRHHLDADDFHPRGTIEKMRSGTPLTDEDRYP